MKNVIPKVLHVTLITAACIISVLNLSAQNYKTQHLTTEEKNEIMLMKRDGVSDQMLDKWLTEHRLFLLNKKETTNLVTTNHSRQTPVVHAATACSDMGGENGWGSWEGRTGTIDYNTGVPTWGAWSNPPPAPNMNTAIEITSGGGSDICIPSPGSPALPVVSPGFGNNSIRLGAPVQRGAFCEQIQFPLTVNPQDTNFIYSYAIVLDNPADGNHVGIKAPHAEIYILDANNDTVPCSHQLYYGSNDATIPPGFYTTDCKDTYSNAYKPWTVVGVNLSKYLGTTVTIIISNYDCALKGHFCHSYWDFMCPPVSTSITPFCVGASTTMNGPISSLVNNEYTYQWYINKPKRWTPITGETNVDYTVIPQPGDTFAVKVHQPSNCDFWIPFIPTPSATKAAFTDKGNCGKMNFQDSSYVLPASSTNSIVEWDWQFPGGTPSSSMVQNPGPISYPPGTYTVTLISKSVAGCVDTIQHVFTVGGYPTASFIPNSPCLGVATTLLDGSLASAGDPIKTWNWIMPGGIPATATSTSASASHSVTTTYITAGTHTVSLIVTSASGCIDTITQQVLVYNLPVANFVTPIKGCSPVTANYTDASDPVDGTISSWNWSFPGGVPSRSTVASPSSILYSNVGSYSVSLAITNSYGCKDSITLPMVEVYPWPISEFCVAPHVAPATDPVFNFCDMWTKDVVKWQWDFGDGSPIDTMDTDPVHSYSATANNNDFYKYNICIRVQNTYGCWDTTCHPIELTPEFEFYIPNTFTPNGDHINETFFGKCRGVKEYNIWLFDRWGNQIWSCHKEDKNTNWDSDITNPRQEGLSSACQWDGVVVKGGMDMGGNSGEQAQEDVYVWKVKLLDIFDKRHSYIGHVNIVR